MTTFTAFLLAGVVCVFYGVAFFALIAVTIGLWLMVLDDLRERRLRKRLEQEAER